MLKALCAPWKYLSVVIFPLALFTGCSSLKGTPAAMPEAASSNAIAANTSSMDFGSVTVGSAKTLGISIANTSRHSVGLQQATINGAGVSLVSPHLPLTLSGRQSVILTLRYAPQSAGTLSGSLMVTRSSNRPTITVSLSGIAAAASPGVVAASPASLAFGSVQAGASKSQSETLSNTGAASVTISQANMTGSDFTLSGLELPLTLEAGQSLTFNVLFSPHTGGSTSGSIALVSNASTQAPGIALSGIGIAPGQLAISPAALSFGNVTVGANHSQTVTLTATGGAVTISSDSVSSSEFSLGGISLPLTLAAGQSLPVSVQFTPQATGTASASASFTSDAAVPTVMAALSGAGIPAPQHSVGLAWSSNSSAAGYFVYRGAAAGGPYAKLNSAPNVGTSYSDAAVEAGQTYFYVTTAVDQGGIESDYSNEVQAAIPSP